MSVKVLILLSLLSIAFAKDDGFKFIRKVYEDCSRNDVISCLKKKAILFFDRASRMDVIPLVEGIDVVKSGNAEVQPISENEIDAILPRNLGKDEALNEVLWDRVASFANSRTIQLSLPKISGEELNKGVEEGRGKMKKMMGMMMMGGAMKMMALLPLGMAGLFVLAGKALIVAKIALLLSGLMILKKLMSQKGGGGGGHGGGGHESHGWSSGGGGYDRRSYDGSDLAYSGYNSDNKKDSHAPDRK